MNLPAPSRPPVVGVGLTDRSRRVQSAALVVVVLLLALLFVQSNARAARSDGNDFSSYLGSARALFDGSNPYRTGSPFPYIYPLFLALALIPLLPLPSWVAVSLWFGVSLAALVAAVAISVDLGSKRLRTRWGVHLAAPTALGFVLLFSTIQNNFLNGQVNFIVLCLCVLFLYNYRREQRNLAAYFLALAVAIKLVPLIFLLFLAWRREVRTLLATVVLSVLFCALPVVFLGSALFDRYVEYAGILLGLDSPPRVFFSLGGFVGYVAPSVQGEPGVAILSAAVVIAGICAVEWMRRSGRGEDRTWLFHLYLVGILLISPLSEKHHLAFLIPPALLISLRVLYDESRRTTLDLLLVASFWVGHALGSFDSDGPFHFLAIVLLFVVVARQADPIAEDRPGLVGD